MEGKGGRDESERVLPRLEIFSVDTHTRIAVSCLIQYGDWRLVQRLSMGVMYLHGYILRSTWPSIRVGKSSTRLQAWIRAGRVHMCLVAGNSV